jgi:hypothetical protein
MGLPAVAQILVGFASIFGSTFIRLTKKEKLVTAFLSGVFVIPSLGAFWFFYWFMSLLIACYGHVGYCEPSSKLGYFLFLLPIVMIAWGSAFTVSGISSYFSKRQWWPSSLKPDFGGII